MPRIFVKNSRRGLHLKREHKNTEDEQVQKKISCAARLAANISSQVHSKDEHLTSSENNVAENCTPLRRSWSFDSESSESLPELEIEVVRLPGQFDPKIRNISGRRIIDISHFITEVRRLENHVCHVKPTGYLSFDREQKIGLHSKLFFKCAACGHSTSITTNKPDKSEPNANFLASWGALASGKGHFFLEEYLSLLDIPPLTKPTFLKYQQELGDSWNECLTDSIQAAGAEEYKFAVESNNMAEGNIGQCTVVVDGGWSHRSYGHRYTSKSGVACIIGKHTKQLLFIGVRNKYCSVCAISERKGEEVRRHKCFKNWSGSSPAMEADIIVEGFIHSQSMHNLQYTAFIADGDSSVHSKILEHVPYSRKIKKIECANHLTKNVTKHLHELAKETSANRKLLSSNRINYIGKSCRKLISIHARKSTPCVANLKHDLQNVVSHVFGNHRNCRAENCLKVGRCNENDFQKASTETQLRIMRIVGNLTSKADSLITDSTSNSAEQFMRQVAKFNSAKQTFYGRRNSFNIRCHGAGLAYQFGPRWMIEAFKHKFKKSPSNILKRLVRERTNNNFLGRSRRKRLFNVEAKISDKNCDYGASCNKPDLPDEEIQNLIKEQIKILNITCEEQMEIEKSTRGQSDNPKWFEARKSRLTASKFGEICKRRINHGKLVESMLYKTLPRMKQIEYGKMNESVAIEAYSSKVGKYVSPCGLFVCTDQGYGFLGASPDGLVDHDKIIEVKCPYSAKDYTPLEAAKYLKNFYCRLSEDGTRMMLDRKHNYFYQIQGQMYICARKLCDFIVWTPKGIHVETIQIDKKFIENMMSKLKQFYFDHYAVELVDSRHERNMPIRCYSKIRNQTEDKIKN